MVIGLEDVAWNGLERMRLAAGCGDAGLKHFPVVLLFFLSIKINCCNISKPPKTIHPLDLRILLFMGDKICLEIN